MYLRNLIKQSQNVFFFNILHKKVKGRQQHNATPSHDEILNLIAYFHGNALSKRTLVLGAARD